MFYFLPPLQQSNEVQSNHSSMLSIGNVWTFHAVLLFSHDRDWTCRRKGRKMHGKKSSLFSNADLSIGSLESIHVKRIYNGIKAKRHLSCWWQVKDSAETGYEYNMQAFKKPSRRWTFIVVAQAAFFFPAYSTMSDSERTGVPTGDDELSLPKGESHPYFF